MTTTLRDAWAGSLYGPTGFYSSDRGGARRDFATAPTSSPQFAAAIMQLAGWVDDALGHPDPFDVVDVGAGDGSMLAHIAAGDVHPRWRLTAVEVTRRPPELTSTIAWQHATTDWRGLLIANEWLDNVPCEVTHGGRVRLADGSDGPAPEPADAAWLDTWWPSWREPGVEAECGRSRDEAWTSVLARGRAGLAVAIDYGHTTDTRRPTLAAYRAGRQVEPEFGGSTDITAHVALDALADACAGSVYDQRTCLQSLGVDGRVPPRDSPGYAARLAAASDAATLLDAAGYGGFGWVVASLGCPPWAPRHVPEPPPAPSPSTA